MFNKWGNGSGLWLRKEGSMHRFFVESHQIQEGIVEITGEDFKHITKVLRLREKECIEVCDGQGKDYKVLLKKQEVNKVVGEILKTTESKGETVGMEITLFQGLPKGQKMEQIIQKNVELGAFEIIPFQSKRSVSQIKDKKEKKNERFQRIAYEAAKQSKRGIVPKIRESVDFREVMELSSGFDLVLVAYEGETEKSLKSLLGEVEKASLTEETLKIGVLIGPEGGFADEEIEICKNHNIKTITLGSRILRTETAGMVVLSQLNFWKED